MQKKRMDALAVEIYDETDAMGQAAASFVAKKLNKRLEEKDNLNLLLATGASQFTFLEALQNVDLNWSKITTFHLDEYVGISPDHPASFRKYLHERIIDAVAPRQSYFLEGDADDVNTELERYEQLLQYHPIDVACIGIGENGHIAFNDPPVADFDDPKLVKVVPLDDKSRQQQVDEGWFDHFEEVPEEAFSLTIPAIMNANTISCVVPDERKADAVYHTLHDDVSTSYPATILRTHSAAVLFLDRQSAYKIQ